VKRDVSFICVEEFILEDLTRAPCHAVVSLMPSAGWAAPGSEDADAAALLGISARVCKATNAGEHVSLLCF